MSNKAPVPAVVSFLSWLLFCFLSCAGSPHLYQDIDDEVRSASYIKALSSMEKRDVKSSIYNNKNVILYYLDRGIIEHYAGLWHESSKNLEEAERLIEAAFTRSIGQEISSYIINDNAKDYSGEDYEDLYINVFNALNYYQRNDIEGALVEVRRVNEKLIYLADKYERAREKVVTSNTDLDDPQYSVEAVKFSNSALARYLSLLFYRAQGNYDSVRIDFQELHRAYELAPDVYNHPPPASLDEEISIPQGKARLNVLSFTGMSPIKEEVTRQIPLPLPPPNTLARLALPRMLDRPSAIERVEVVLNSRQRFTLELLEDMSRVATETFKAKYSLTVIKTAARTIAKTIASAGAAKAAEERAEGLGFVIGLLGKIASDVSEQADLRMSRYFPGRAYVGGINLDPGIYSMTVNYYGNRGLIASDQESNVLVEAGKLNLMKFVCLK